MSRERCNLCGSYSTEVVGRVSRYLLPLETVMCTTCGLVFSNPVPDPKTLERFYSRRYRFLYQGVFARSPPRRHIRRRRRAARKAFDFLGDRLPTGGPSILEIGCGSGEFLALCRERELNAVGIEPGRDYARHARDSLGLNVHTTTLDAYEPGSKTVALVVMMEVLEHLKDPSAALSKVNRMLIPGGRIFVTVPNVLNTELPPISRFHFAHIFNFSPRTLEMMMQKAGFEPVDQKRRSTVNLFEKVRSPSDEVGIDGDAVAELRSFFAEHTGKKYVFSWPTYRRFLLNLLRLARDHG